LGVTLRPERIGFSGQTGARALRLCPEHPLLNVNYMVTVGGHQTLEQRCTELSAA
jgi:hypothetical protein